MEVLLSKAQRNGLELNSPPCLWNAHGAWFQINQTVGIWRRIIEDKSFPFDRGRAREDAVNVSGTTAVAQVERKQFGASHFVDG